MIWIYEIGPGNTSVAGNTHTRQYIVLMHSNANVCICCHSAISQIHKAEQYTSVKWSDVASLNVRKTGNNDWFLEKISLVNLTTGNVTDYPGYRWLTSSQPSVKLSAGAT